MIKLIVSDIDGTLLEEGTNRLNPELLETILMLRKKGIQFAAASGRHQTSVRKTFDPILEKIFIVADNGAYLGCKNRHLFLYPLNRAMVFQMIEDVKAMSDLSIVISGADIAYMEKESDPYLEDWVVNGYQYDLKLLENFHQIQEDILKVALYRKEGVDAQYESFYKKYGGQVKLAISGRSWLDVIGLNVNKGEAVKTLQESLGIAPEETMVFGDQMNDLEMMKQAYYSFAVGNAREEVKKAARFQADTSGNNGVLKVLKQLL